MSTGSGVSTTNLPLSFVPQEFLGHEDLGGGARSLVRFPKSVLAAMVAEAGTKIVVPSKAILDTLLNYPEWTGAEVHFDPVGTRNGVYYKVGASGTGNWVRTADLRGGPQGVAGPSAEFRVSNGELQWRTVGTAPWIRLLLLSDLGVNQDTIDLLQNMIASKASQSDVIALISSMASLQGIVNSFVGAPPPSYRRPADGLKAYTFVNTLAELSGEAADLLPVAPGLVSVNASGAAIRIKGSGIVASREAYPIETGRIMAVRVSVSRAANASDPNNDAVRGGVVFFDQAKQIIGSPGLISDLNALTTGSGRDVRTGYVSTSAGSGVTIVAPPNAAYFRSYVQNFGADGLTDVETLATADVTGQTVPPTASATLVSDVAALKGQNAGERLTAVEAALNAPNSVTYATRTDATAASPPTTVTTILTRSDTTIGDARGALWRRATQAQALAAVAYFQSANGAYWARVDDGAYATASAPLYPSPNLYRPRADRLTLFGPGSTGDVSLMSILAAGAQQPRTFEDIFRDHINALDEIKAGEGAQVGINRAINLAYQRGRGTVLLPNRGTAYNLTGPIVMRAGVHLVGLGMPRIEYDSENIRAAIISEQFDALLYTGAEVAGDQEMLIQGIYVYGKWTSLPADSLPAIDYNTPTSRRDGVAIYGRSCHLRDLTIERVRGNGLHYAYGNQGSPSPFNGRVSNVTITIAGEHGWLHDIDDLHGQDVNVHSPSRARHGGFCGILARSGYHFTNVNVWSAGGAPNGINRPKYGLWNSGGGGAGFFGGTIESGTEGTVRIDTTRVVFVGRAHSTCGIAETISGTTYYRGSTFVLNGSRCIIIAETYHGSQSTLGNGNGGYISPLRLGGSHRLVDQSQSKVFVPSDNYVMLQISGYTRPINLADSGGRNKLIIMGDHGDAAISVQPLFENFTSNRDYFDVNVYGPWTESRQSETYNTLNAVGNSSATAALISSAATRVYTQASGMGAILPESSPGDKRFVFNRGPGSLQLYPHSGGQFWGANFNVPITIPANKGLVLLQMEPQWAVFGQ